MSYTLLQTINWAKPYVQYMPLYAGINFEPAISIASIVRSTILNAPFTWPWNRGEYSISSSASAWISGYSYAVGNMVTYGGSTYVCITANAVTSWTAGDWAVVSAASVWAAITTYLVGNQVTYNGVTYVCVVPVTSGNYASWATEAGCWAIVSSSLAAGIQDYVFPITDFAYLEKISLLAADGSYGYELADVYNRNILGIAGVGTSAQAQPKAACVKLYTPGTSVAIRFLSNPDQAYTGIIIYQKLFSPFSVYSVSSVANHSGANTTYTGVFDTSVLIAGSLVQFTGFITGANNGTFMIGTSGATTLVVNNGAGVAETPSMPAAAFANGASWLPIPDSFMDIYNNLFLAEVMAVADDPKEQIYRQRGVAALLSKAEGLSEMQVNAFLAQQLARGNAQELRSQLRTQQGTTVRGI